MATKTIPELVEQLILNSTDMFVIDTGAETFRTPMSAISAFIAPIVEAAVTATVEAALPALVEAETAELQAQVDALENSFEAFYQVDGSGWTGSVSFVEYDVSATVTDAKKLVWQFQDNANDNKIIQGADISFPDATTVRVEFGIALDAGTYTLVGR